MKRRGFLSTAVAGAAPAQQTPAAAQRPIEAFDAHGGLIIERAQSGKPHAGKVLAAIQPHSDDIPIFAAGTVIKLIASGSRTRWPQRSVSTGRPNSRWTASGYLSTTRCWLKYGPVRRRFDVAYRPTTGVRTDVAM